MTEEQHSPSMPASSSTGGTPAGSVSPTQSPGASQTQNEMTLAPRDVDFMPPLLRSFSSLLRLRGKVVSTQFLLAGLAGTAQITPTACLRAAERAGLKGRIAYRATLGDISPLTLPCILLLHSNRSCVLKSLKDGKAEIILPEHNEISEVVDLDTLNSDYSGYVLFASLEHRMDSRASAVHLSQNKRWFWDVIWHYLPIYKHVALASVVINLIGIASPLFVMNVYDRVVPNNAIETLWVLALGIVIAYLFDFILRALRNHFVDVAGRNADVVLSSKLVDKVLTMRLDARPESTGALVNNLREFESLREFFSSSTLLACIDLPFLFIFLLLLAFIGGPLVFLPLVAMPILLITGFLLQQASKHSAEQSYKQGMQKNALLVEIVNGMETLKCCQAESRMQRLWEAVVGNSAAMSVITRKYSSFAITFSMLITQIVTVASVVWGVYLISEGKLTMGGLIGCNILIGRGMAPLLQIANLLTRFQNSRVSLKALDFLMALPSENQDEKAMVDFGTLEPSFAVENVSFSYPASERMALENVSFRVKAGEKIGVIGRMGSGKSTLGKLLIGLYQPGKGSVKFGDVDIRQLAGSDIRGRVGFLPQDVVLFYGSIRDNIALGDPSVNDHLVMRAALLSGVSDFIRSMPAGFATQVGEQGKALSGGQRQAVALARALLHDPDVLILDEPTSNMDDATERVIQRNLSTIMQDKTVIVVTHRPSMLKIVDRLIVMDHGKIVMDGPKEEILGRLRGHVTSANRTA